MTKVLEREKAIRFRKEGKSYREILKKLKVSKSTLSLWLRKYPLTEDQIQRFKDLKEIQIEKYIKTMRDKRLARLDKYYYEQKEKWLPFSQKELFIAGLFLYWGEGDKGSRCIISINNTDPSVVKFALLWLTRGLGFPKEKVKAYMHLYNDMDVEKELQFWISELGISRDQFCKPYIKISTRNGLTQMSFGHGTCGVRITHTPTKERILMAIKAISENFAII